MTFNLTFPIVHSLAPKPYKKMEEALKVFKDDNPTIKDIFSKYTDPNTRAEQWDKICKLYKGV